MKTELIAYLKHCWKAILTFGGMMLTNVAVDLMQSGKPWPDTGGDWLRFFVSSFLITWIVWRVPNGPKPASGR